MSGGAGARTALVAVLGTLFIVGLGIGGFALGRSTRTPESVALAAERAARARAYAPAESSAYETSWTREFELGLRQGEQTNLDAGALAGRRRGEALANRRERQDRGRR